VDAAIIAGEGLGGLGVGEQALIEGGGDGAGVAGDEGRDGGDAVLVLAAEFDELLHRLEAGEEVGAALAPAVRVLMAVVVERGERAHASTLSGRRTAGMGRGDAAGRAAAGRGSLRKTSLRRRGVSMVVTRVMRMVAEYSRGPMMAWSKPMTATTRATSPRLTMPQPTRTASAGEKPPSRAPMPAPTTLVTMATAIRARAKKGAERKADASMRKPTTTKKSGMKR